MELQTRSKEQESSPEVYSLGKRIARVLYMGLVTVAGAIAMIAVVLGILFFSGETSSFIYMNF
ncbi:hypothetical protein [Paenibacillus dakarensis]|uniref:hypothetical protein n=1 Tax=Paenibacillus dakarensis TaxID=1527293 RepID=UPI0009EB97CB|nr:hypothetical protein [Paenibacillus dakarensis]